MSCTKESAAASRWMPTAEAARYLGISPSTLCNDRCTRSLGVPFARLGRKILYYREALDRFLLARMEGQIQGA